jgi:BhlA holin family
LCSLKGGELGEMEQLLLEFGLKDGIFVGLFVWLMIYTFRKNDERETRLYGFLDSMKTEFAKLVGSYEQLSKDVTEIREELQDIKDNKKN